MFEVGEKVVYPNHGVSIVEEISSAAFHDMDQTLFHLRLLSNNSKVMVPKENLELVGLRRLCNKDEIQALIDTLRNGEIDTYKDWKGRYKQNLDKMKTGQLTEVAEVLKNLCLVSQKKSLSFREKKMYERAKYFIVSEIGQVREMDDEAAEDLVEASLETSLEKRARRTAEQADRKDDKKKAGGAETKSTAEDAGAAAAEPAVKADEKAEKADAAKSVKKAAAKKPAAKKAEPKKITTAKKATAKKPAAKKAAESKKPAASAKKPAAKKKAASSSRRKAS